MAEKRQKLRDGHFCCKSLFLKIEPLKFFYDLWQWLITKKANIMLDIGVNLGTISFCCQ